MLDEFIIKIVAKLERDYRRGIYPWMVQARLPVYRAEQTIRRDMVRLAEEGRLERVGEMGKSRLGYRMVKAAVLREEAVSLDEQYAELKAKLMGRAGVSGKYTPPDLTPNPSPRREGLKEEEMVVRVEY